MKRTLLLIFTLASIMLLAASCRRYVDVPVTPPLTGNWFLQSAERYDGYKWQTINTGYESGTFYFKANGDVLYRDAIGDLRGSWSMYPVTDGYYDGYGHYKEGYHVVFSLRMYEPYNSTPATDWFFEDNDYNGGAGFRAVYTSGSYTYQYNFARE